MDTETLKERIEGWLAIDPYLSGYFCHNCPAILQTSGSYYSPPEYDCPCEFGITDGGCSRHGDWLKIAALVEQIADIATETCRVGGMEE